MVTRRPPYGRTQLGCLVQLLIIAATAYFGAGVGQVYWDFFQYKDRMQQEARFAGSRTDNVIKKRIALFADSLGLPESARRVHVRRRNQHVDIWAEYYENIELPFITRQVLLNPHAEAVY